jgi:exonuclease SbcD
MRILHTSDWHIGRSFHEKSLLEDQAHALEQLHRVLKEFKPDAVIIAGDLYDRAIPPAQAVVLLNETLKRIALESETPVFIISGNHDSAERVGFGSDLFRKSGVHIVSSFAGISSPLRLTDEHGTIDIYGIPYLDVDEVRLHSGEPQNGQGERKRWNALEAARSCLSMIASHRDHATPAIAVAHTFVQGARESQSELPLSIGGLDALSTQLFSDYAYTALGHLHRPQNPAARVRYSGSLLSYHFDETDSKKSFTLVELGKDRMSPSITEIPIEPKRALRVITGKFSEILEQAGEIGKTDDYVLVRRINDGPVLDIAGKLREHFPNLCSVELLSPEYSLDPAARRRSEAAARIRTEVRKNRNIPALFESFYKEMTLGDISEAEKTTIQTLWSTASIRPTDSVESENPSQEERS